MPRNSDPERLTFSLIEGERAFRENTGALNRRNTEQLSAYPRQLHKAHW